MARPWPVDAREDDVVVKCRTHAGPFTNADLVERGCERLGCRSLLDRAVSEFNLGCVQQNVESGRTMQAVKIDDLDTVEVHDAYVLHSGSSQHLENELADTSSAHDQNLQAGKVCMCLLSP
jgi:hypothetical protein